ncbi:MAG: class I SAM-dependent methyltransferase [Bacteroidetes bacterium]|nr:class I SAM-dependent methyltransferase [Bacteroidota bacterium]MBU1116715.1 class I SAM-dependent methyltransferase [Bacteroidota bacterium]MBU1799831.1 class I SAM-dependent methyltransferase [Bacteroidota bacterium]
MQERHTDRKRYFNEQVITTEKYVIPFLNEFIKIDSNLSVLEIGCGEGGNLKPFLDLGCTVTGVDLSEGKIENGKIYFADHPNNKNINFLAEDIYDSKNLGQYDLIIMRDVIEHIHDQNRFMNYVKKFLKPNGKFFLAFPPWYNPFGGHQQICESRVLSMLPYYHILPSPIYKGILKLFGESIAKIDGLMEVKSTGISLERFEKILKINKYNIDRKSNYFINPNYEIKFGLKPRKQIPIISLIPFVKNFIITSSYYLISVKI